MDEMLKMKRAFSVLSLSLMLLMVSLFCSFIGSNSCGKIVFHSDRDGNLEIYVIDADGSSQVNLTNNPALNTEIFFSERDQYSVIRLISTL